MPRNSVTPWMASLRGRKDCRGWRHLLTEAVRSSGKTPPSGCWLSIAAAIACRRSLSASIKLEHLALYARRSLRVALVPTPYPVHRDLGTGDVDGVLGFLACGRRRSSMIAAHQCNGSRGFVGGWVANEVRIP